MSEVIDALAIALKAGLGYQAIFFCLLAIGINVQFGYTGLLNFGQIAFALLGGFGIAISVSQWGLNFWVGVLIGLVAAIGPGPAARSAHAAAAGRLPRHRHDRRRRGPAAAVPLGVGHAGHQRHPGSGRLQRRLHRAGTLGHQPPLPPARDLVVRRRAVGRHGRLDPGRPRLPDRSSLLMRSPWGRVVKSIREDEDAVRALGKNVYSYKIQALVIGGIFGALGGMIYAVGHRLGDPRPVPEREHVPGLRRPDPRRRGAGVRARSSARSSCCSSSSSPTPRCAA